MDLGTVKFKFFADVQDRVSGFIGKVTAYAVYASGCVQAQVMATALESGKPVVVWIDDNQLEALGQGSVLAEMGRLDEAGGPQETPPGMNHPGQLI